MGFSRQEHWNGLLFPPPGDLPNPGIEFPALQMDSFPLSYQGTTGERLQSRIHLSKKVKFIDYLIYLNILKGICWKVWGWFSDEYLKTKQIIKCRNCWLHPAKLRNINVSIWMYMCRNHEFTLIPPIQIQHNKVSPVHTPPHSLYCFVKYLLSTCVKILECIFTEVIFHGLHFP